MNCEKSVLYELAKNAIYCYFKSILSLMSLVKKYSSCQGAGHSNSTFSFYLSFLLMPKQGTMYPYRWSVEVVKELISSNTFSFLL